LLELKAKCGEKDPQTLRVMSLLGEVYHSRGWNHQSDRSLRPCLTFQNKTHGPTSFNALDTAFRLALLCQTQGKLDEAAELLERCWHAYEDTRGFENPITLQRASRLFEVYHEQKQFTKEVLILRTILQRSKPSSDPLIQRRSTNCNVSQ
jgi:hypothetical protein